MPKGCRVVPHSVVCTAAAPHRANSHLTGGSIMAAKEILFREEARRRMLKGVTTLATSVKATMGPKGRNVMIEKSFGGPKVTKDGVSVAKEVELSDKFENLGAQMVREAAKKTADVAGDGTTTATVLSEAIFREGVKFVSA